MNPNPFDNPYKRNHYGAQTFTEPQSPSFRDVTKLDYQQPSEQEQGSTTTYQTDELDQDPIAYLWNICSAENQDTIETIISSNTSLEILAQVVHEWVKNHTFSSTHSSV